MRGDHVAILIATYLHTGPHSTMTGILHVVPATIAHDLGLDEPLVRAALARMSAADVAHYDHDTDLVWLVDGATEQIGPVLKAVDNRHKRVLKDLETFGPVPLARSFWERHGAALNLGKLPNWLENVRGFVRPSEAPVKGCEVPPAPLPKGAQDLASGPSAPPSKEHGKVRGFEGVSKPETETEERSETEDPRSPLPPSRPQAREPSRAPKSTAPRSTAEEDLDRLLDGTGTARRPRDTQATFQVLDGQGSPPRSKTPPQADSVAGRAKSKRGPSASELAYLEAYRRGVVTGSGSNVVYTAEHMTLRPLVAIAQAHCRGLIGDALKDELERIGEAYARAVGKSQFHLGFKPGRCLDWLNSGRPTEAQRSAQRDPDRGIQQPMAVPLETNIPEHLRRKANP